MSTRDLINLGIAPDSGTGDSARRGGAKINMLFADLYTHLGDNPVGQDPAGDFYGYRQTFGEYEYKVGEIHAAGRYVPIKFKTNGTLTYTAGSGWGVDGTGSLVDTSASGIPDIYEDSEWFFLSRGDSLGLDLREVDSDKGIHLVLPLAIAGDVIRVRDTFDSWGGRYVNVWTSPYEFQTSDQVTSWMEATGHAEPDSDSISVSLYRQTLISTPYKKVTSFDAVNYPTLSQDFHVSSDTGVPTGTSQVYLHDEPMAEIVFTYLGARRGWVMQVNALQSLNLSNEVERIDNRLVQIDSDIAVARSDLDSDSSYIQTLVSEADSDVRSIAQLRRDADSDSRVIQRMSIQLDGGVF